MSAGRARLPWIACFWGAVLAASWWWMMILHEAGHVLHAAVSGAEVERVRVPLLGFSRTDLARNPQPVLVAWGGFVWGSLLPLAVLGIAALGRLPGARGLRWFAAFCLVANGAYLATTLGMPVGDVEDVVRGGGSRLVAGAVGLALLAAGVVLLVRERPWGDIGGDRIGVDSMLRAGVSAGAGALAALGLSGL